MRRIATVLSIAVALTACSGDDASPTDADDTQPAAATSTPSTEPGRPAPPLTAPTGTGECEDEPDPTDYVEGQIPAANRPCGVPTALDIHPIRDGVGRAAEDGDTLIVDYTGVRSEDGTVFDTSYTRDIPLDFVLGRGGVIEGWDEGLQGVQAGSALKLDIPAELAYGDAPPGGADSPVQPGDALSFVIEVRAVVAPVTADDAPLDLQIEPSVGALEVTTEALSEGDGGTVDLGDTAVVHMLLVRGDNEVVLFNTWERMDPLQIIMEDGRTLPGVFQSLQGSTVGSRLVITMPPADAFGEGGEASLGLPANTDLIAVVDVVGVY